MRDRLTPSYMFGHYYEVTPQFLKSIGVRALLSDIDNTLAPYEQPTPDDRIRAWIDELRQNGILVALVSNNHEARVREFNETLGLVAFWDSGKPNQKALLRAAEALGVPIEESAMLGDQLLTDSYAGHSLDIPSIIVPPIRDKTNLFYRFKRLCERPFIRKYAKQNGYREWMSFWKIKP